MADNSRKKFSWKAFTSLYVTYSFLIMIFTGIILYIAPAGRIAKWSHISILGLEKDSWQAIHIIFTFLFIVAGGFHLYYNWKPFVSYLKTKVQERSGIRKELVLSTFVTLVILLTTLFNLPPFSYVIDLGEYFTDLWATEQTEPPVPHAEAMSIKELSKAINIPVEDLLKNLEKSGIQTNEDAVVSDIADKYGRTPLDLFDIMQTTKIVESESSYSGSGIGRKKLSEIAIIIGIETEIALQRLADKGIEADAEMTLRDLANKYDKQPIDLMTIIEGK